MSVKCCQYITMRGNTVQSNQYSIVQSVQYSTLQSECRCIIRCITCMQYSIYSAVTVQCCILCTVYCVTSTSTCSHTHIRSILVRHDMVRCHAVSTSCHVSLQNVGRMYSTIQYIGTMQYSYICYICV